MDKISIKKSCYTGIYIIIAVWFLGLLVGCNSGEEKGDDSQQSIHVEERMSISWTTYLSNPVVEESVVVNLVNEKFGVNIDVWDIQNNNYNQVLEYEISNGNVPDLLRVRVPSDLFKYASEGIISEIPIDILMTNAPDIYERINSYDPDFWSYATIEGGIYGIPIINVQNIFHKPLVYRKDWMEAVGVSKPPETLEEFEALMYKFAHEDPDGNGIDDTYGLSYSGLIAVEGAYGFMASFPENRPDTYFFEEDGMLRIGATHEYMKEILAKYRKWYEDGVLDPEFIGGENEGDYWAISHAFAEGKIGFTAHGNFYHWIPSGTYDVPDGSGGVKPNEGDRPIQVFESNYPQGQVVFGPPLEGPYGHKGIMAYNQLMNFVAIGRDVLKEEGKLEKILQILNETSAHLDKDVRMTYRMGLEDVHWRWIDRKHDQVLSLVDSDSEGVGGYLQVAMPFERNGYTDVWARSIGYDLYGIESEIQMGFPEISEVGETLRQIRERAHIEIITGDKPLSYFDEFVTSYNGSGGQLLEDKANEWYLTKGN